MADSGFTKVECGVKWETVALRVGGRCGEGGKGVWGCGDAGMRGCGVGGGFRFFAPLGSGDWQFLLDF
jgi:hypothetical protein